MLSISISLDEWIEQRVPPAPIPGDIHSPCEHHKDNLGSLEPIFKMLLNSPKVTGFTERLSEKTNIHRSTLSTWRRSLLRDPASPPMRHHDTTEFSPMIKRRSWQLTLRTNILTADSCTLTPISRSMHSDVTKGSSAKPKGRCRRTTKGLIQEAWDVNDGEDWRDLINEDDDAEFQEMRDVLDFAESHLKSSEERVKTPKIVSSSRVHSESFTQMSVGAANSCQLGDVTFPPR
jgi:hypothetical protein